MTASRSLADLGGRAEDLDRRTSRLEQATEVERMPGNYDAEVQRYQDVADHYAAAAGEMVPHDGAGQPRTGEQPAAQRQVPKHPSIALRHGNLTSAIAEMRGAMRPDGTIINPAVYRQARDRASGNASELVTTQHNLTQEAATQSLARGTKWAIGIGSGGAVVAGIGGIVTGSLIAQNNRRQYDKGT